MHILEKIELEDGTTILELYSTKQEYKQAQRRPKYRSAHKKCKEFTVLTIGASGYTYAQKKAYAAMTIDCTVDWLKLGKPDYLTYMHIVSVLYVIATKFGLVKYLKEKGIV